MRLILSLLALLFIFPTIAARTITGRVLSDADSCALAGAVCRISVQEGSEIAAATADDDGLFSITTDNTSPLDIQLSMVGFSSTVIKVQGGRHNVALGDIYLSEGIALQGLTVTAQQRTESRGRTLVYPSKADIGASPTAASLFQKLALAGLQVNPINRTVSVDGGSPVILINGVPSTIDDFHAILPADIERVEYSRITPPRYAASGHTGFINITLRKRTDGGQIYAWTRSAVATGFVDGDLRGSYHQGKSQFTLAYSPSWRNYQRAYDFTEESLIGSDGFDVKLSTSDRNPFNYLSNDLKFKYDYTPTQGTVFSATFNSDIFSDGRRTIGHTSDSRLGEYDIRNKSHSRSFSPSLDLYFRRDFNEANSLEAQVVTTLSSGDYFRNNLYLYPDGTDQSYDTDITTRRRSVISALNYVHNFGQNTTFSTGYQNTLSHSENTYINTTYKPILSENHNYIYASFGQQVNKVYFNVASGLKLFWTRNDINKRNFVRNISSVTVTWSPVASLSLQGVVKYQPAIPSLTQLTDYAQQVSPYLVVNGNPDLRVADKMYGIFSASYNWRKLSVDYQTGYVKTWHPTLDDVSYIGNGHFLSNTINGRYSDVLQHYIGFTLNNVHGFGANVSGLISRYNSVTPTWSHRLTAFEANLSMWYNAGKFTFEYWRKFPGKYADGYFVGRNENGDQLSVNYAPSKQLTLTASWMYMFDSKGTRYPQWSYSPVNPSYRERYIRDNSNMVVLSLRYSTNFGSIFRTANRTLNNSDSTSTIMK